MALGIGAGDRRWEVGVGAGLGSARPGPGRRVSVPRMRTRSGAMRDPSGRGFGGGRVRVYGCSPGCLLLSLGLSLLLTILLNLLIRAF